MKNRLMLCAILFLAQHSFAQVGIGTTTPNSMLDVRGAMSLSYRSFTSDIQIGNEDNTIVFTGNTDAVATLPDASTCPGRMYRIKNASTANVTAVLIVGTSLNQPIDGSPNGWKLDHLNEAITIVSNGSGWYIAAQHAPFASPASLVNDGWALDGNSLSGEKKFGTISTHAIPFITDNIERMRLTSTGRLGIGTTNPMTELQIFASPVASGIVNTYVKGLTITGNGSYGFGGPGFYLENTDNPTNKKLFKVNYTANGGADGYINFQSVSDNGSSNVNANILAVMHSGRIGIGTAIFSNSNPEKLLVDAGPTTSYNLISGKGIINDQLQINIQNHSSGPSAGSAVAALANNADETSNFIRMGINSNGYNSSNLFGGGNTTYLYGTGGDMVVGNASTNKQLLFFTGGITASNEIMRLNSSGIQPGADNTFALGKNGLRWSEIWSVNGVIQTSDARLKTNIQDLPYGLKEVVQMRPVSYNWKDKSSSSKIGLIAQEVKKIVPEVVTGNENVESLGMNYAELVPVLINAIKELKAEVDELKKKLDTKATAKPTKQ
ncbi:MAG: tail fiber domain-containing protein [Chitinophagaceae bacterium]|nr:tail fiber domain-containing protein [Chitinophagaceae bacterium]